MHVHRGAVRAAQFIGRGLQPPGIAAGQHQTVAACREQPRQLETDAGAAARDQGGHDWIHWAFP